MYFFVNDTATTEIYTLSLHDALPISFHWPWPSPVSTLSPVASPGLLDLKWLATTVKASPSATNVCACGSRALDRKSTRLNSSHANISYAVFCLIKKKHLSSMSHRLDL